MSKSKAKAPTKTGAERTNELLEQVLTQLRSTNTRLTRLGDKLDKIEARLPWDARM